MVWRTRHLRKQVAPRQTGTPLDSSRNTRQSRLFQATRSPSIVIVKAVGTMGCPCMMSGRITICAMLAAAQQQVSVSYCSNTRRVLNRRSATLKRTRYKPVATCLPLAWVPSQRTVCPPAGNGPDAGVATLWPVRSKSDNSTLPALSRENGFASIGSIVVRAISSHGGDHIVIEAVAV